MRRDVNKTISYPISHTAQRRKKRETVNEAMKTMATTISAFDVFWWFKWRRSLCCTNYTSAHMMSNNDDVVDRHQFFFIIVRERLRQMIEMYAHVGEAIFLYTMDVCCLPSKNKTPSLLSHSLFFTTHFSPRFSDRKFSSCQRRRCMLNSPLRYDSRSWTWQSTQRMCASRLSWVSIDR